MNESLHRETRDSAIDLTRDALESIQLERLNRLLAEILPRNPFYRDKLAGLRLPLPSLDELRQLPFTTKGELSQQAIENPRSLRTYPMADYSRVHRTSGSTGAPIYVFDTQSDWQWWIDTWQYVLDAAAVTPRDHALMAFSFGPFIGFWSAYDALVQRGAMVVPTGGMSSRARLECLFDTQATLVCCTPTYAMHLAEVAVESGLDLTGGPVRALIVAGEPGGSIPAVRDRLESLWGAAVIDHAGASEVGPWGFADRGRNGLRITESEFIAEFLPVTLPSPQTLPLPSYASESSDRDPARGLAELVLTPLGRFGFPVVRYRTGDVVVGLLDEPRPEIDVATLPSPGTLPFARQTESGVAAPGECGPCRSDHPALRPRTNGFVRLPGGILGRADDMLTIRGVNVFPTAIEAILRKEGIVSEFRIHVDRRQTLDKLRIEVESTAPQARSLADALQTQLGLRVDVLVVPPGSLPRFEGKARRIE